MLFHFLDFFGNLVGKAVQFVILDSGYVRADEAFDCIAGFAAFLGGEKKSGRCTYKCAAKSGDYDWKSFQVLLYFKFILLFTPITSQR